MREKASERLNSSELLGSRQVDELMSGSQLALGDGVEWETSEVFEGWGV